MKNSKINFQVHLFSKGCFALTVKRSFDLFFKMKNVKMCSFCLPPSACTLMYLINGSLPATLAQDNLWLLSCVFCKSQGNYSLLADHSAILGV